MGRDAIIRAIGVREMLESGIAILRKYRPENGNEKEAKELSDRMMEIAYQAAPIIFVSPRIVRGETKDPDEICIRDLDEDDLIMALEASYDLHHSYFYGKDRNALEGLERLSKAFRSILKGQQEICYLIDAVAQRYSLSPLEIERWNADEMARVTAIMEGADQYRKDHPPEGTGT